LYTKIKGDYDEFNTACGAPRMGKVVNFSDMQNRQKDYKQLLLELHEYLEEIEEELISRAVNIAIADKWYNWDQSVPVGTRISFDEQMLYGCGDENVSVILDLRNEVDELRKRLMPTGNQ